VVFNDQPMQVCLQLSSLSGGATDTLGLGPC
jgi:hypothetical protein